MKLAYVRWRDAAFDNEDTPISDMDLAELHEVGFLIAETADAVKLAIEHPGEATSTRLWLVIPKVNIIEMRVRELDKAFPKRRRKS
jgi:hypothetical protein